MFITVFPFLEHFGENNVNEERIPYKLISCCIIGSNNSNFKEIRGHGFQRDHLGAG